MTDDIVTRLRNMETRIDNLGAHEDAKTAGKAAAEIERLRKQRDELAWAIAWFLNGGSRDKLEQRFASYEETINERK